MGYMASSVQGEDIASVQSIEFMYDKTPKENIMQLRK